jgi:hypothetical protein
LSRLPAILLAIAVGGTLSAVTLIVLSREPPSRQLIGGRPVQYWVGCLDSGDAKLREAAERNLPLFGAAAVDPLIERLDDDDDAVVIAASAVIFRVGPAAAVPRLVAGLRKGGTPFRRIAVIRLLKSLGPAASASANPLVAAQLADRDVAPAAADYFVAFGPDVDALVAAARCLPLGDAVQGSDPERVLQTAWRADQRWRGVVADVLVKQARTDDDPRRRGAAWQELARWAPTTPSSLQLFAEGLDDPQSTAEGARGPPHLQQPRGLPHAGASRA